MRFLVDAHLPRRICEMLVRHGHESIHTHDLPEGNASKDGTINRVSLDERRVVVSKDSDFFYSHLRHGRPWKLLLVKTGNISTRDLVELLERNLPAIDAALQSHSLVEVDRVKVTPFA
jgi:predicted nuclease of predicted toxin-antitoxin system